MALLKNTVRLEQNYETWKKIYKEEKDTLEKVFGPNTFTIEHIGSTAVPGLAAKPIVDIAVGVEKFSDLDKYMDELKSLYSVREQKDKDELLLVKEDGEITYILIHVMPISSDRYKNVIKFRDTLINNPEVLKEYEELKTKLAEKYSNDRKAYTASKNEFITEVLKNVS